MFLIKVKSLHIYIYASLHVCIYSEQNLSGSKILEKNTSSCETDEFCMDSVQIKGVAMVGSF